MNVLKTKPISMCTFEKVMKFLTLLLGLLTHFNKAILLSLGFLSFKFLFIRKSSKKKNFSTFKSHSDLRNDISTTIL